MRTQSAAFLAAVLFAVPSFGAEVPIEDEFPLHGAVSVGAGAGHGLLGMRLEVGYGSLAGFVGTGVMMRMVDGPGAVIGMRWEPLGHRRWLVTELHLGGAFAPRDTLWQQYAVLGATVGAQGFLGPFRFEAAVGPALSYGRVHFQDSEGYDGTPVDERRTSVGFGIFPDQTFWGPLLPDFTLSIATTF